MENSQLFFYQLLNEQPPQLVAFFLIILAIVAIGWLFMPWLIRWAIVNGFEKLKKEMIITSKLKIRIDDDEGKRID